MTREAVRGLFARPEAQESRIFKDNLGRVLTKIVPPKIQARDFSRSPIEYQKEESRCSSGTRLAQRWKNRLLADNPLFGQCFNLL